MHEKYAAATCNLGISQHWSRDKFKVACNTMAGCRTLRLYTDFQPAVLWGFPNIFFYFALLIISGFGGLVVSMLVPKIAGSIPAEAVGFFGRKNPQHAFLGGEVKPSPMSQICAAWKSKSQAKLTGHFSPVIPSFADRGLSCRWHVEAPRGESGNV